MYIVRLYIGIRFWNSRKGKARKRWTLTKQNWLETGSDQDRKHSRPNVFIWTNYSLWSTEMSEKLGSRPQYSVLEPGLPLGRVIVLHALYLLNKYVLKTYKVANALIKLVIKFWPKHMKLVLIISECIRYCTVIWKRLMGSFNMTHITYPCVDRWTLRIKTLPKTITWVGLRSF